MRRALMAAGFVLAASSVQAAVVDFESFAAGAAVNSITFSDGTTATVTTVSNRAVGGTNQAGVFDTDNPTGNDGDLGGPFSSNAGGDPLSPGKILIILGPTPLGGPDDDAEGGTITLTFDRVVDLLSFNYFDTEAEGDHLMVSTDTGGASGALIAGDNEYGTYNTPFLGITTATFSFGGSGGLDNLEIADIAEIPVPAALPLLFSALGMFWLLGRTRRSV